MTVFAELKVFRKLIIWLPFLHIVLFCKLIIIRQNKGQRTPAADSAGENMTLINVFLKNKF